MDDSKGQPLPSVGLAVNDKGNINTSYFSLWEATNSSKAAV